MIFSGVYIDYIHVFDIDVFGCLFFGHLKLRDLYMSLTYFDRCILTLYGIGASNFFFVKHSLQICIVFTNCTHVTRGTCYCRYKILCCFWGVQPCFLLVALSQSVWLENLIHLCGPLARLAVTSIDIASMPVMFCKAHMKELQEFNQHWDQKVGSSTSRWWEFIRMHHKDAWC